MKKKLDKKELKATSGGKFVFGASTKEEALKQIDDKYTPLIEAALNRHDYDEAQKLLDEKANWRVFVYNNYH